jgi:polyhydroxybutyrate depolymerase
MTQLGGRTFRVTRARWCPPILVVLALAACGGSGSVPTSSTGTGPPVPDRVLESRALDVGGVNRTYGMFVPGAAATHPPLVVMVHLFVTPPGRGAPGGAGDGRSIIEAARRDGFAVASPQGIDFSFNGGTCCGAAVRRGLDDVGFLDDVIRDATRRDGIDAHRVYLVGFSNGAFLSYRFACERPTRIAGAAIVEGALLVPDCRPSRPVNLLVMHQTGDETVPLAGTAVATIPGDPVPLPSVAASLDEYLHGSGCTAPARHRRRPDEVVSVVPCRGRRIESIIRTGGAHRWPATGEGFDAARAITRFFDLERT